MPPPSSPADSPSRPPAPGGYALVARRVGGWTANLLATAIVLVASLAIGRQVLSWWHEAEPAAAADAAASEPLPDAAPQELRWWTARGPLTIEQVRGDEAAVLAALRRRCREAPAGPFSAGISVAAGPAATGPGEEHYAARLANERPIEQTGDLDLYQPSGGLTQVVAVARQTRRIAAWSFALPSQADSGEPVWSCYTIHAAGGVAKLPAAGATP
jgi:hypothetical protein